MATGFEGRYYCRGADGPNGHCDNQRNTIQCDYCIWFQKEQFNEAGEARLDVVEFKKKLP
jgi:hypothetical protein